MSSVIIYRMASLPGVVTNSRKIECNSLPRNTVIRQQYLILPLRGGITQSIEKEPPRGFAFATTTGRFYHQFRPSREETGKCSVPLVLPPSSGAARSRKPRLLFALLEAFVLRYAAVQFSAELFQLPPRFTRDDFLDHLPVSGIMFFFENGNSQFPPWSGGKREK